MKNIIFDLDGTLIDSMPSWQGVGRDFLISKGVTPPDNIEELFKTMSFEESHAYFAENFGLGGTAKDMIDTLISMVKECYEKTIPLKPYAYQFLQREYEKGTKMCILSASEEGYIIPALKRLKMDKFFCNVFTCTDLGMSKSSGDIYTMVAKKIGGTTNDTAVFEDACHAVVNAKAEGFYTVGVEDESAFGDREKIMAVADRYIKSYKELL